MHVALIYDRKRLLREEPMLNRLCVGVMSEGASIVRVVPEHAASDSELARDLALAKHVSYTPKVVPWFKSHRRDSIVLRFGNQIPDVIYAIGRESWGLAVELSSIIERPVVLDVWSSDLAHSLSSRRKDDRIACYVAATRPIAQVLRRRVSADLVAQISPGVSLPPKSTPVFKKRDDEISIAILGTTTDVAGYRSALQGLATILNDLPQAHVFMELAGKKEHDVWRIVRSEQLLPRVSTFIRAVIHRKLITQCDLVILPESTGEVRTIVLDVMAAGIPIVAREDPILEYLQSHETAVVVKGNSPTAWKTHIEKIITQPLYAQKIAAGARELIKAEYRSSTQAESLYTLLERVMAGGAYRFEIATTQ